MRLCLSSKEAEKHESLEAVSRLVHGDLLPTSSPILSVRSSLPQSNTAAHEVSGQDRGHRTSVAPAFADAASYQTSHFQLKLWLPW